MIVFRPSGDCSLEHLLVFNHSYELNVFDHRSSSCNFQGWIKNKTNVYKTIIVPNDPADYGRNSYETQTLNSVFEGRRVEVVDVLKLDQLEDMAHSHELLYFMVKDRVLTRVRQLYITLHIGPSRWHGML